MGVAHHKRRREFLIVAWVILACALFFLLNLNGVIEFLARFRHG